MLDSDDESIDFRKLALPTQVVCHRWCGPDRDLIPPCECRARSGPGGPTDGGSGGSSAEKLKEFLETIKEILATLFRKKIIHGQNVICQAKSTDRVVSCNELKSFINDEYNKFLQNPGNYQRNNLNQNNNGGYGGGYGSGYNNGYGNGGGYGGQGHWQWGTGGYGMVNDNGNFGGYNGGYGYGGGYG